ncbi:hypothetical protein LBMAG52_45020 [Planctomycetia bacterium]|jgi:hypothetical protein|nr:hypothetical protein LBMAG52_45020 [Planctomycetia bacterium]
MIHRPNVARRVVTVDSVSIADAWRQFWRDDAGFVVSAELIFITTIMVIGLIAGLSAVRNQMALELADLADAVSELNQSFSFAAVTATVGSVAGSNFVDAPDLGEAIGDVADQNGASGTQGLVINGLVGQGEQ